MELIIPHYSKEFAGMAKGINVCMEVIILHYPNDTD